MKRGTLFAAIAAVCVATAPSPSQAAIVKYRAAPEYVYGTYNEANPASSTKLPTTATLAFPDITLDDITNHVFSGYISSGAVAHPASAVEARRAVQRDAEGHAVKIVTQIAIWDNTGDSAHTKAVIVEFTNGTGGVFVRKYASRYRNTNSDRFTQFFTMDANGTVTLKQSGGNYDLYGLRGFSNFLPKTAVPLWTSGDPANPLTLNDITNATFTARTAGGHMMPSIEEIYGYNRCITTNAQGDATSLVVEFQAYDDGYVKSVVAEFTEDDGVIYGKAIKRCYVVTTPSIFLGYRLRRENGTYTASADDSVATASNGNGYGIYGLTATVETPEREFTLDANRSWSEFTGGVPLNDAAMAVRVKVTGDSPVLTFDENVNVGKLIIENGRGGGAATNSLVVAGGASVAVGELALGENARAEVPSALASVGTVFLGAGATAVYAGEMTVSSLICGAGGVEVASGRVTFTSAASSFGGGVVVKSGAVAVPGVVGATGATYALRAGHQHQVTGPFGRAEIYNKASIGYVRVEDGGMVDLNGQNYMGYVYVLAGNGVATGGSGAPGPFANLGPALNIGTSATKVGRGIPWQATGYILAGDVSIGASGEDLGIVSDNDLGYLYAGQLDLNTHVLTKKGAGTLWLWTHNLLVKSSGALVIEDGAVDLRYSAWNDTSSKITVGAGTTFRTDHNVTANSITNSGTIDILGTVDATIAANYYGDGDVVKSGAKTATVPFNNASKSVYTVNAGTLKAQGRLTASGGAYGLITEENPRANQLVDVKSGATFDFNGIADISTCVRLAANATVANTGGDISYNNMQMVQLMLTGDASAKAVGTFGLLSPSYGESRLELNGHTLTLVGTNKFWMCNTKVLGSGTLVVATNGILQVTRASGGADWTLTVDVGGELIDNAALSVRNFVNNGTMTGNNNGILTVTGTLTAGNPITKLTLADGATVKMSGTNTVQSVTTAFSASGTITIDATAITMADSRANASIPVLSAPSFPANVTWVLRDPYVGNRRLKVNTEGGKSTLLLNGPRGFVLVVR
ncbi:MAG: hypothetical protein J6T51_03940 [Kiritimatiellae bacterium]|nr:hypothetical protein [Kiritimatiellia bacterium]